MRGSHASLLPSLIFPRAPSPSLSGSRGAAARQAKASFCGLCRKQFTSPAQLTGHLEGKLHKETLLRSQGGGKGGKGGVKGSGKGGGKGVSKGGGKGKGGAGKGGGGGAARNVQWCS